MAFRPILFSTPMIEAIVEGRKTQTRRVVKYSKEIKDPKIGWSSLCGAERFEVRGIHDNGSYGSSFFKMPICKDDILWVRESWNYNDDLAEPYIYKQKHSEEFLPEFHDPLKWRPSIHMPFDAARIFLKVKDIRIEKLHEISVADSRSEGIKLDEFGYPINYLFPPGRVCAQVSFETLWKSINGVESWDLNPWVWVYEFEVLNATSGTCILCGCVDSDCKRCIAMTGNPCHWINSDHTVCSACKTQNQKP